MAHVFHSLEASLELQADALLQKFAIDFVPSASEMVKMRCSIELEPQPVLVALRLSGTCSDT